MISCTLTPDESRHGTRGVVWVAAAEVDGERHEVRVKGAATCALARMLVAAGVRDQPMEVCHAGIAGVMIWPSLHRAAELSITEGSGLVNFVRYSPMPEDSPFV